jgi:hypothetical protein
VIEANKMETKREYKICYNPHCGYRQDGSTNLCKTLKQTDMKIFISYLTTKKEVAGKIKESLETFGYSCFLAHEDIRPTQIWIDEILENLHESDILLAIITDGFESSQWCNQEIGYFIGCKKLIIPVKINENPPGFISKYQALKASSKEPFIHPQEINEIIGKSGYLLDVFKEFLVDCFIKSPSYVDADFRFEEVAKIQGYNKNQIERILNAVLENSQIYDCFKVKPKIKKFINGLTIKVNQTLIDKAKRKII